MIIYKYAVIYIASMRNKIFLHIVFVCLIAIPMQAQNWRWWPLGLTHEVLKGDTLYYEADILGVVSTGKYAPFWLQSNRNGNISASPYSGNISVSVYKPATQSRRWYDYDFGVQLTGRVQSDIPTSFAAYQRRCTGYFNQLYVHTRLYFIDITSHHHWYRPLYPFPWVVWVSRVQGGYYPCMDAGQCLYTKL